ncbi:PREDICTED: dynactin subunit 1-like [Priapulus caudatus]|uniref:Dynactin subunit 1 n=1 Tax=Priapulus caudatus TaxID=37621 RepID=A0ABM1ESN4_PRICU|nr:PREDICTED: dynactin subunit 1-like [Priapulus caudatus]
MAEKAMKLGTRVEVIGKDVVGVVAYVGSTMFSSGKWIGVALDVRKGKNNGVVQGKKYFTCPENHGIFVRQSQLNVLNGSEAPSPAASEGDLSKSLESSQELKPKSAAATPDRPSKIPSKGSSPSPKDVKPSREAKSLTSSVVEMDTDAAISNLQGSTAVIADQLSVLQHQQEIENLTSEIKDLNEKMETLKIKRTEDKNKLKEFEKVKIQMQQLVEYKTKMQEAHAELNRQLQNAKKEAKDAVEARDRHADEMADGAEALELAALDKEMAEEKSEQLQAEVDQLKEKLEEVTLDYEIMKQEISDQGKDSVATSYQVTQMGQQMERLKEALVKMRDFSQQEKVEHQRALKETEKMKHTLTALTKDKEKLTGELAEAESQLGELKEQVDAALGAEEMVETLAEKNLALEEKLQEMEETVADLEALHEMNEEMQENSRDTELEMREQLDLSRQKIREADKMVEASQETMVDYEQTIQKFRRLVEELQERNRDLIDQQQSSESKASAQTAPAEKFDFKMHIEEVKAHSKAIDMELRKLEVRQANEHIQMLCSFMPDTFMARGGDHDAMLVLLLVPRICHKAGLLAEQVSNKFELTEKITKELVIKSQKAEQASYARGVVHCLISLQTVLHRIESSLALCPVDLFLRVGSLYSDFILHEKTVDFFIQLLKKDQLDENISLEPLEKACAFFNHVYSTYLSENGENCTQYLGNHVKMFNAACDWVSLDIGRLQLIMLPGQETSEISILLKDIATYNDDIKMFLKKIKRRMPQDEAQHPLVFSKDVQSVVTSCAADLNNVAHTVSELASGAMQQLAVLPDVDGLPAKKLDELAFLASDKVYGADDGGPFDSLRQSMQTCMASMNKVTAAMQEGEYDYDGTPKSKPTAPIFLRAATMKSQVSDIENLKFKVDAKEEDIKELKKALKIRAEEVSELNVRIGLAEKKLENASKDGDERAAKVQRKLDEAVTALKKKEKEYEQTMDVLQGDIDALEHEKSDLKEKLKSLAKKAMVEGLAKSPALSAIMGVGASSSPAFIPSAPAEVKDSPLLLSHITALKEALHTTREESWRLKCDKMKRQMECLSPLIVPRKAIGTAAHVTQVSASMPAAEGGSTIEALRKRTTTLFTELNKLSSCPKVVDITRCKPGAEPVTGLTNPSRQLTESAARVLQLQNEALDLQVSVTNLLASYHTGGQVRTDFSAFPTPGFAKALQEKHGDVKQFGRVSFPRPDGTRDGTPTRVPIVIAPNKFKAIHEHFLK